ncbi:MAG: type II toxin-antitoxin system VapC family toxin [Bryobacterales bacterium]|nr:type II toxin-antitoxin system VapC family toxin [Bryobacterales bacterium]
MAEQYKKPYLESSVFIALIKGESIPQTDSAGKLIGYEERGGIGKHILSLAETGQFSVYTSSITITEVNKDNPTVKREPELESKIVDFFRNAYFKIIDVDRSIAESAHRLCRKTRLRPYDAVHLACAIRAGCDALLTWDSDLLKLTGVGIAICKPQALGQAVLDLTGETETPPEVVATVVEESPVPTKDANGERLPNSNSEARHSKEAEEAEEFSISLEQDTPNGVTNSP